MRCACVANGALRGAGRTTRSAHTRQPTVLDIGPLIGGEIQEQAGLCQTRGWTGRTRTAAMSAHDKGFSIVTWSLQALLPDFTLNASSRESRRSPDSLVSYSKYSWFTFVPKYENIFLNQNPVVFQRVLFIINKKFPGRVHLSSRPCSGTSAEGAGLRARQVEENNGESLPGV